MADNVPITGGSGFNIAADEISGVYYQRIKLDVGNDGVSKPVFQGGTDGLPVDVLSGPAGGLVVKPLAGQVFPVNDNGAAISVDDNSASLTVDAPQNAPVFVRLSDGTNPIATLPVSGSLAVTQSTPAAAASGWPMKITDGTDTVGISSVSTDRALKVDVIQSVGVVLPADEAAFTAATTKVQPIAGVFNDSLGDPSSGQLGGLRMTQKRALHISVRKADATELGVSGAPFIIDPAGTTKQPVNLFDNSGNAFTDANPLAVQLSAKGRTRVTKNVSVIASQTGATLWTPTSSTRFNITSIELTISVAGDFTVFDGTNAGGNILIDALAAGLPAGRYSFNYQSFPWVSAAVNNVLKYTSGTGLVAKMAIHGFETT